ncbi:hypothetical protein llap_16944 [Limosa lapponica baueri]|uniref:Uncharacterized protein n=1 Tax=Limosa lapponica baueri TaxID=1758121 RepID=A0A2I0TG24_LIMLA|nr:hypothetical protein llap_16944 [Limosa lapponica baueri]
MSCKNLMAVRDSDYSEAFKLLESIDRTWPAQRSITAIMQELRNSSSRANGAQGKNPAQELPRDESPQKRKDLLKASQAQTCRFFQRGLDRCSLLEQELHLAAVPAWGGASPEHPHLESPNQNRFYP